MPRPVRTKVASRTGPTELNSNTQSNERDNVTSPISKLRARRKAADATSVKTTSLTARTATKAGSSKAGPPSRLKAGKTSPGNKANSDDEAVASVEGDRIPATTVLVRETDSKYRKRRSPHDIEDPSLANPRQDNVVQMEDTNDMIRQHTPSEHDDTTGADLYELSPGGERSQARIHARLIARRQSIQAAQSGEGGAVRATPGMDRSTLALTNFKRRARQPSLLRMITQPSGIGVQDQDDVDFTNIDDFDLDLELEPDDQSTPLPNKSKHARLSDRLHQQPSDHEPRTTSSKKRKRGHGSQIQVPDSSLAISSPPPDLTHSRSPAVSEDLPEHPVHATGIHVDPQVYSDTMAPPMSSSSILAIDEDEIFPLSPQSTRKQPGRNAAVLKKVSNGRTKAVTTVALESLLPRAPRHRRAAAVPQRDGFDLPGSDGTETSDRSSSTPEPKSRRRPKAKQNARTNGKAKTPKNVAQASPGRLHAPAVSSPVSTRKAVKTLTTRTNKKARQTYGQRKSDENKENQSDDGTAGSDTETDLVTPTSRNARARSRPLGDVQDSAELEAARVKFAEVDEWEMEFESVESGPTSSDWR